MVEGSSHGGQLSPEFRQQVLGRIGHWQRLAATEEEKLDLVAADAEWTRLTELEVALESMSTECCKIGQQIASLEVCHEHYVENVKDIAAMIDSMTPGRILDCGQAKAAKRTRIAM